MQLPKWLSPKNQRGSTLVLDPVHGPFWLGGQETRLIETDSFERLRGVRQLLAHTVFPTANHTRFEHSLGVFYLVRKAIAHLQTQGHLNGIPLCTLREFVAAALLHDVGHYPYSHTFEGLEGLPPHEEVGRTIIESSEIATILERDCHLSPEGVADFIDPPVGGGSRLPGQKELRSLLDGYVDVDKGDYVPRDLYYTRLCSSRGVYSFVQALAIHGSNLVIRTHGVSALQRLHKARNLLYREVYWHPAVRACECLIRRAVQDALLWGALAPERLWKLGDMELLGVLVQANMPSSTRDLVQAFQLGQEYRVVLAIDSRHPLARPLKTLTLDAGRRRYLEQNLAELLGDLPGYQILIAPPGTEHVDRPLPVLKDGELIPWEEAAQSNKLQQEETSGLILCAPHLYASLLTKRQEIYEALARALSSFPSLSLTPT
jgi:HD superfamily phosphohydrolase